MLVPALVLVAVGVVLGAVGVLARVHRLPRNRVLGVRTPWTMARVDTFRRANRAAAPAFAGAGGVGVVAGTAAALAPSTATTLTLLAVGAVGTVLLVGVGGVIGSRFALLDEAEERAAQAGAAAGCCTAGTADPGDPADDGKPPPAVPPGECAPTGCAGACSLCPRGGGAGADPGVVTSPRSPGRP